MDESENRMSVHYADDTITLHHGNALDVAGGLEQGSAQTIVTSPPYFGLRDYDTMEQLGAEKKVADYVSNLVTLFDRLRPALADDGTLWLNLGDSYSGSGKGRNADGSVTKGGGKQDTNTGSQLGTLVKDSSGLPPKNLIGVPWRVALALQDDGWILRSDIIWAKPNPMPEPVQDRPTKSHEYLFLFAKQGSYYYDAEAISEAATVDGVTWETRKERGERSRQGTMGARGSGMASGLAPRFGGSKYGDAETAETRTYSGNEYSPNGRRNKRDVWTVPPASFSGAHFAVFPPELIRPCILAGSRPGDTVLDPFSGSGTTGMVATQAGRKYIGIDLNAEYLDLSLRTRFAQPSLNFEAQA